MRRLALRSLLVVVLVPASFSFACSNSGGQVCSSGRVGGWLKR